MQKCLNIESRVALKGWLGFFIGGKEGLKIYRNAIILRNFIGKKFIEGISR